MTKRLSLSFHYSESLFWLQELFSNLLSVIPLSLVKLPEPVVLYLFMLRQETLVGTFFHIPGPEHERA